MEVVNCIEKYGSGAPCTLETFVPLTRCDNGKLCGHYLPTGAKGIFTGWQSGIVKKPKYFMIPDHSKNKFRTGV